MEADKPAGLTLIRQTMAPVCLLWLPHIGNNVLSYGRTHVESAPGLSRCLVGLNGSSISALTSLVRRPPKRWTAGQKSGARAGSSRLIDRRRDDERGDVVDGLPNSTLDERHLDCKCLRRRQKVLEKDVET